MTRITQPILFALTTGTCALAATLTACSALRLAYAGITPSHLAAGASAAEARAFTVSGTASIQAVPDLAVIGATLAVDHARATEATRRVRDRERAVMEALDRAGIARKDVALTHLQLNPIYDAQGVVSHYRAALGVKVTSGDFARLPELMEVLAGAGATELGTELRVADLPSLKKKLRGMAVDAAKAKTSELSAALGFDVGKLRTVAEAPGDNWGWNGVYANSVSVQQVPAAAHGDLQTLTLTVNLTYELA